MQDKLDRAWSNWMEGLSNADSCAMPDHYDAFCAGYYSNTGKAACAQCDTSEDLRSIFRRCVDIIGFHNGDDAEKLEAIRNTMLQAKRLAERRVK